MKKNITKPKQKRLSIFSVLFLFGILLFFNSCDDEPIDELNKKINIALRSGNEITENERNEFIEYINENSLDLPQIIDSNNEINQEELTNLILSVANKRRNNTEPKIFSPNNNSENEDKNTIVSVFIENSGSMDGYVQGTTEFEAALSDLLVQLQYKYNKEKNNNQNLNINFINTKIYPSKVDEVNNFVETLEPSKAPYKVGNRSVSKLNEILEIILDSTKQNEISILTSDCIYSLDKGKDTEGALEFQKSLTKGAFLEKSKEFDFSTIVLKMNSKFDGYYYDKDNNKTRLSKKERPYYFWIIGKHNLIETFQKEINLKQLKGFENSYYLSNSQENNQPFFTVLKETNKIGNYKPTDRKAKDLKSINEIEYENGNLQFSIAIDLNNIPVDKTYLTNSESYIVPDGFIIKSIEEVDRNKIEDRDFVTVEKTTATHIITIATSNKFTLQDLKLELSNKIPAWVEESNSIDDRDVENELDKTFGLLYLVQGVSEAYTTQNPNNKSYFNINIEIKK
ncbi:hypothetical protein ESY86_19410 [Subsaximicrobium wynnwilliamsii]|uniref:Uncharacterized protein n=1 Tax=Subsaximicrobium wynnwilliamsii TaxID=291179 RepID=A0A5C6ZCK8_9FLAO|nr:hypothetical protein [Subsaximicrobium wynnwilliamsii]TXD81024.1 hypothetical protein ESY87_19580 [Subsaximicrobium wynnwilliamsii]TXD86741.1 hypothetical protein ESY86_19410 [Subsaximicrobium wynnwilliamsii]TXE00346.1 hypothetical protein ESY88_19570 [Subsaximicrobium wynnwilliamsii]